jgi:hypothetical protein
LEEMQGRLQADAVAPASAALMAVLDQGWAAKRPGVSVGVIERFQLRERGIGVVSKPRLDHSSPFAHHAVRKGQAERQERGPLLQLSGLPLIADLTTPQLPVIAYAPPCLLELAAHPLSALAPAQRSSGV